MPTTSGALYAVRARSVEDCVELLLTATADQHSDNAGEMRERIRLKVLVSVKSRLHNKYRESKIMEQYEDFG